MSDHTKKKFGNVVSTTTQTETRTETLTREEELVVRMRHGLSESDDAELTFTESRDDEVKARLRMMEAALMAQMHGEGPLATDQVEPKDKILAKLKRLEDD